MPFDGSGNFSRDYNWQDDRDNGIRILASRMDGECDNFAAAFNVVFFRNGLVPMSGNLNMGQNYIIGLGAGSVAALPIRFADDPNSGMYLNGINKPTLVSNGVRRIEANTTGADINGALTVSAGVAAGGALSATTGAFSGAVTVASLASAGAISGTTGTFSGAVTIAGGTPWTNLNDGAGSGLDADLLDGQSGAFYQTALGYTPVNRAGDTMTGRLNLAAGGENLRSVGTASFISFYNTANTVRNGYIQHTGSDLALVNEVAGALLLYTSNTERVNITAAGDVGIGVTPTVKLHVNSGAATTSALFSSNGTSNFVGLQNSGSIVYFGSKSDGSFTVQTPGSGFSDKLIVDTSGNVGIGVSPSYKLHVAGDALVTDRLRMQRASSSLNLVTMAYWNGTGTPLGGTKGDMLVIGNQGGDGLIFANGDVERMRIDTTGQVGIGVSPTQKLDVYGGASGTDTRIKVGNAASNCFMGVFSDNTTFIGNTFVQPLLFLTGGTERMRVSSGGDIVVAGSVLTLAGSQVAILASPAFTGTPTAPTAVAGTSTTQLATTAFVTTADNLKANLASPTFTGTPVAPTAGAGTNTTQIATTAFVATSFAPLASPTFTGVPAAPTAGAGTSTTQLATTAFVTAADNLKANLASPALTGTPTTGGNEIGYRDLPASAQNAVFAFTSAMRGCHVYYTGAAAAATINTNATTSIPIGGAITIVNDGSGVLTLTRAGGVALIWNGADANRALAVGGMATMVKVGTDRWFVSGIGLS